MSLWRVGWKLRQLRDFIDSQIMHSEAGGNVWLNEANISQIVSLSRKLNLNMLPALLGPLVANPSVFERAAG